MQYIVFDLEFNQDFTSELNIKIRSKYPFEIIQIGAIKLDEKFNTIGTFDRYVKPTIYKNISPFITGLTGITTEQLKSEEQFPMIYRKFLKFIGEKDTVFCIWGMSDIKELFKNAEEHQLNTKLLPKKYINIQPYVSIHFGLPTNQLLRLQYAVEALQIPMSHKFHDAINDAYYTAEIFKKINHIAIETKRYDPSFVLLKPRRQKRIIDFDQLFKQFEKMYQRELTKEEKEMVKLAYQMGRTNQFIKLRK